MSYGGATQAMVTAIRNNKKLLSDRKARHKDLKNLQGSYTEGIKQKEFSIQKIEAAKKKYVYRQRRIRIDLV